MNVTAVVPVVEFELEFALLLALVVVELLLPQPEARADRNGRVRARMERLVIIPGGNVAARTSRRKKQNAGAWHGSCPLIVPDRVLRLSEPNSRPLAA